LAPAFESGKEVTHLYTFNAVRCLSVTYVCM